MVLAGAAEVRRIVRFAVLAALLCAAFAAFRWGFRGALVLTLSAVLSIVNFRLLQLQVSLLEPRPSGGLGARNSLLLLLRLGFLFGLVGLMLYAGRAQASLLPILLGFAVIPIGLVAEAVLRVARGEAQRAKQIRQKP